MKTNQCKFCKITREQNRNYVVSIDQFEFEIKGLKQENFEIRKALERIANTPDDYEMEYCRDIAIRALEELI